MGIQDVSKKALSSDSTGSEKMQTQNRYAAVGNDIVKDATTGLEWIAGPDEDTTWDKAKSWVDALKVDGGGWRMPTAAELETIYEEGLGDRNMPPLLKTTGWDVWAGETEGPSQAGGFSFYEGERHCFYRGASELTRGFAVRSRKVEFNE